MENALNNPVVALIALTLMEIVLGIDNIVFIAIVTARLPVSQQPLARRLGLILALGTRIALLSAIQWITTLTFTLFTFESLGLPEKWVSEEVNHVSMRDIILFLGGLFLIYKSVQEIHNKLEGTDDDDAGGVQLTFAKALFQIAILDIIFSLDSVITAVAMAEHLWVMITAVVLAVIVMLIFSESISHFVSAHPTIKMLALSFLMLIGVTLIVDASGAHIDKGYVYFAMAFALGVEMLNLRMSANRKRRKAKAEKKSKE